MSGSSGSGNSLETLHMGAPFRLCYGSQRFSLLVLDAKYMYTVGNHASIVRFYG